MFIRNNSERTLKFEQHWVLGKATKLQTKWQQNKMEAWKKKNLQREGTKGREARGGYRNKGKKNKGQQTETGAE